MAAAVLMNTEWEVEPVIDGQEASGTDWSVTRSMACATVTSFGSTSAGEAEAVRQYSLPASYITVNRDYDHIMQMTVPSVYCSLVLAGTLSLCCDSYLSPRGYREFDCAAMCWQAAEGDRKPYSDKYTGINYSFRYWVLAEHEMSFERWAEAAKNVMFPGWDFLFLGNVIFSTLDTQKLVHYF